MKWDFSTSLKDIGEVGFIERAMPSLAYVKGLPGAHTREVVVFESGEIGEVTGLEETGVEIMSFAHAPMSVGMRVARTNKVLEISLGVEILGAIIDPLGCSLDTSRPLVNMADSRPIETIPSGINTRGRIKRRCATGVALVDLLVPIGKGQRELVMGDQKTGKSLFLMRAMMSQVKQGSVGIYAAIGKSQATIKQVEYKLREMGARDQIIVVASPSDSPASTIYLTPYVAMTIAEYFRDKGRDVLIVLDDLSTHAKVYREIALLARRFPGRNAYPGDIFYTHARLVERAGNFKGPKGDVAITCLPVIETNQGDLGGYIQTNAMSMTDGHIFFDHDLFIAGRRPAIDPFLSVTRVGRQTQTLLQQQVGRTIVTFLRSAEKMHNFASFGAELNERIKQALEKEEHVLQFLDQTVYDLIPEHLQLFIFGVVWSGLWREKKRRDMQISIQRMITAYETKPEIRTSLDTFIASCDSMDSLLAKIKTVSIPGLSIQ